MHTHTLLVADESITTQRVIQLTLANEAIQVVVAADGHEALARIEADRPDIILACTTLPGVDGFAIASQVSQSRRLRVPVFLLRDRFESDDEPKFKECGASGVLEKPLDPGLVSHCVKKELRLQAPVDERASEPKPRKTRPSSPPPRSARRRTALRTPKRVSKRTSKSASRPRPSARRKPQVKPPIGFEAACAPMFAALSNHPVAAGAITPEMLVKYVSDAVGIAIGQAIAHAIGHEITGNQGANGLAPEPAAQAKLETVATSAVNDLKAPSTEAPVIALGGNMTLKQLQREMGIDDFLLDDAVFAGTGRGNPACPPFDAVELTHKTAPSPAPQSRGAIRSAEVSEGDPADVLDDWSQELNWLSEEIRNVRAPGAVTSDRSRNPWIDADNFPPQALPARVAASPAACDERPRLASFAADTTAWLRSRTSHLFEPLRGGQPRVRTWAAWLAGASVLKAIGKG